MHEKLTLRGMLHAPNDSSSHRALAVLFHGFTGNRIEGHRLFFHMSNALEDRGIASLRMDFLGSGESDGDYADMTLASLVVQAKQIVSWVKSHAEADQIYLIGFSLGGLVASLVLEDDPTIRRAVLVSPGRARRILERDKALYEQAADVIDIGGNPVGRGYYLGLSEFRNRPQRFHDGQNILVVHGTNDMATPVSFSDDYLAVEGGTKRLIKVLGADHGYSSLAWQKQLIHEVTQFLTQG